jgi:hypothetical protein
MIDKLNKMGIKTTPKDSGSTHTYQTWFKDPNGIDIEFHEYTADSAQITGKDVEVNW